MKMEKLALEVAVAEVGLVLGGTLVAATFLVKNRLETVGREVSHYEALRSPLETKFTPERNGVNIFIIPLKNPGLVNEDKFKFQLVKVGELGREIEFSGANVGDPDNLRFQFAPLATGVGEEWKVRMVPEEEESTNPLLVGVDERGEMVWSNYRRVGSRQEAVRSVLTSLGGRLAQDKSFMVAWLLLIGLSGYLAVRKGGFRADS